MLEKISHACQSAVDFTLNKVEMPITKKIYSSTGDSTLYKVILISSMILPLIALLELTLRNMLYLPLKNLLMTLTRKNPVVLPFYKREVVKIGTIGILSSLVTGIACILLMPPKCPYSQEGIQVMRENTYLSFAGEMMMYLALVGVVTALGGLVGTCLGKKAGQNAVDKEETSSQKKYEKSKYAKR